MKPRTKLQHKVVKFSKHLPDITPEQKVWSYKTCLDHIAYRNKTNTSCLDCGHIWKEKSRRKTCVCPNCNTKLKVEDTRKLKLEQEVYFAIITTCGEFQVCRYFELTSTHKRGKKVDYFLWEVAQQWILPNGRYEIFARLHRVNCYIDRWYKDFEIRKKNPNAYNYWVQDLYNINPNYIYPKVSILPEFKKLGIRSKFYGISPLDMFLNVLKENRLETLLKIKQYSLLKYCIYERKLPITQYWNSIKICVRNKYKVKDAGLWIDYLDLLNYFNKDLHNAKYVCPKNLKQEHDRYVEKKRRRQERERIENLKSKISKEEPKYKKTKAKFFGLCFTDGKIEISPLSSVQEFLIEGDTLHHCVFTNNYYKRKDSLILSAKIGDKRIETIEVSLKTMKIIQCRGLQNCNSKYHNQILELMNENMNQIKNILYGKKKTIKRSSPRLDRVAV